MVDPVRMSHSTLAVLAYLLQNRTEQIHGFELIKATGFKGGTIYPILERLETAGWLEAAWEELDPSEAKRPRRRNYRLRGQAVQAAAAEVASARNALAPNRIPAPGVVNQWT